MTAMECDMIEREEPMAVDIRRRKFTLDEYHRMGEVGILHEDSRVELIEGEIIEMSPIGSRHAAIVARIHEFFARRLGDRATIWAQNPLLMPRQVSEPLPDLILLPRRADFYVTGLPQLPRSATTV
jgi:Uma2 family endonuclease